MKKWLISILCIMVLSACEGIENETHTMEEEVPQRTEESSVLSSVPESSVPSIPDLSQISSVQQLLTIDKVKERLTAIAKGMSNDTQITHILTEGNNTVVVEITFKESFGQESDIAAALEELTESHRDILNRAASELKQTAKDTILSVRYKDPDGTVLFEQQLTDERKKAAPPYATLREYLETPSVAESLHDMEEELTNEEMLLSIFAESDSRLVYQYQLMMEADETTAAALEKSLSQVHLDFETVKERIDSAITVVIRYIDKNYLVVYEKTY